MLLPHSICGDSAEKVNCSCLLVLVGGKVLFRYSFMIGALALAGCGGGSNSASFLQEYADAENEFNRISSNMSATTTLPSGTGDVFTGLAGMTFDIGGNGSSGGGFGLADVAQPGGDYLAVATVEITVNFNDTSFTGQLYNFDADEGHAISGKIDITGGQIDGLSGITADLKDNNLVIDTFNATISGTIDGEIVGDNAESLWASHSSTFSYGSTSGTLSGGLYASQP